MTGDSTDGNRHLKELRSAIFTWLLEKKHVMYEAPLCVEHTRIHGLRFWLLKLCHVIGHQTLDQRKTPGLSIE